MELKLTKEKEIELMLIMLKKLYDNNFISYNQFLKTEKIIIKDGQNIA